VSLLISNRPSVIQPQRFLRESAILNSFRRHHKSSMLSMAVVVCLGVVDDAGAAAVDWKAYARQSLTPSFNWVSSPAASVATAAPGAARSLDLHAAGLRLALSVESSRFEPTWGLAAADVPSVLAQPS